MEEETIFQERCGAVGERNPDDRQLSFTMQLDELDNSLSVIFSLLGLKSRDIKKVILKNGKNQSNVDILTYEGYLDLLEKAVEILPNCPIAPLDEDSKALRCRPDALIASDILGVTFFCFAAKARGEKIVYNYNGHEIKSEEMPNNFADALDYVALKVCQVEDYDTRCQQLYQEMGLPKDFDIELPVASRKR